MNPNPHRAARLMARAGMLAAAWTIAGCATFGGLAADDGRDSAAQRELAAGIAFYDQGEYVQAIRSLLTAQNIWRAPLDTRVTAQKYVAFCHCLSNRPDPCKQAFSDLLRIKPDFELAAAEAGHPQWGAAFRRAKRELGTPSGAADGRLARSAR